MVLEKTSRVLSDDGLERLKGHGNAQVLPDWNVPAYFLRHGFPMFDQAGDYHPRYFFDPP